MVTHNTPLSPGGFSLQFPLELQSWDWALAEELKGKKNKHDGKE